MNEDPRQEIKQLLQAGDLKAILIKAAALHGHYCPGLAYGVKAAYAGLKRLGFENTGMEELLAVVECNNCFVDGVQFASGCTMGNNALIYKDLGKTAVTIVSRKMGAAVRVAMKPRGWEGDNASDIEREASEVFRIVVKERRDDPAAKKRLKQLWPQLSLAAIEKPEDALFTVADVPVELPEYAPIFDSATCAVCGEEFMETRGVIRNGKPTCLSCAQADCHGLLGRGIRVLLNGALP